MPEEKVSTFQKWFNGIVITILLAANIGNVLIMQKQHKLADQMKTFIEDYNKNVNTHPIAYNQ